MATRKEDIGLAQANRGAYSANLIGTIRSHLEGLQGFDVMALELIQNADDAGSDGKGNKATEIVFDVVDDGLVVSNDGEFTYCNELHERPCPYEESEGYGCDYHRITEVASGGKLSKSTNIGRFGIGFVSTYQIADHPEIHSSGIKLTLVPERQEWIIDPTDEQSGTTFFLPWAADAKSDARVRLGASAVTDAHVDQLVEDFKRVLRSALLFLRHLKRAELRRNGKRIISCELDRDREDETELTVLFEPEDKIERWIVLRADAAEAALDVYERYPRLETLDRKTEVSVAVRVEPDSLPDGQGLLYAYLPTEQATGLPVHINADFFPESDRKAVIFSGNQHQQAWNELLIETAAETLAGDLEGLREKLGTLQLWSMLSRALLIKQDSSARFPAVFDKFWDAFKTSVDRGAAIAPTAAGTVEQPSAVLYPRQPLEKDKLAVLQELGGKVVSEDLRPHRNALTALGTKELTFARLVALMDEYFGELPEEVESESVDRVEKFYLPLWGLVEALLPESSAPAAQEAVDAAKDIPFIVGPELHPSTINLCYRAPYPTKAEDLDETFPFLWFASDRVSRFPRLNGLIDRFGLGCAVAELRRRLIDNERPAEEVVGSDRKRLKKLYSVLATLDELTESDASVYNTLRTLPIWMTGNGLVSAAHALLPGDFEDPTGQAELIVQRLLDPKARQFVQSKLGVKRQTIEEFVRTVVPRFVGSKGPDDLGVYKTLLVTLADHPGLLDNDELVTLLEDLPLVPTRDGGWAQAGDTYFRTDELVAVLGETERLWVHVSRISRTRAVRAFLEALGVRRSPSASHLAGRMVEIAEAGLPTEEAKKASEKAFYELCDLYDDPDQEEDVQDAVERISDECCFPADGETEEWFAPEDLHAPIRYQAFQSQAHVLDFKNPNRLNNDLLKELGVSISPQTELVVDHLLHCVEQCEPAHFFVYQILNERARDSVLAIERLCGEPCIYHEALGGYVRPNQLYLIPQPLGQYSFAVPPALDEYKALFRSLGVKESPEATDYADIILDIVSANYAPQAPLDPADRRVYDTCTESLSQSWWEDSLSAADLERLRTAPTMLNVRGQLCHPDEVLLHDSEWHRGFFGDELDQALCKPSAPELGPFFEALGARRLSEVAVVELDFVDGPREPEDEVAERLAERADILVRMLYDKPRATRDTLQAAIGRLAARSHEIVRIKASVFLGEEPISAEPIPVRAFYDATQDELVLARPVNARSWVHVFNALLHQLMPEEPASLISHLALALDPLMNMSHAEAEERLAEAHIPFLAVEEEGDIDLTSPDLDGLGAESEEVEDDGSMEGEEEEGLAGDTESEGEREGAPPKSEVGSAQDEEAATGADGDEQPESAEGGDESEQTGSSATDGGGSAPPPLPGSGSAGEGGSGGTTSPGSWSGRRGKGAKRGPTSHKSSWDRQLKSYVRQKQSESNTGDDDSSGSEDAAYKLAVEAAARAAVCKYEEDRGRKPEEMPHTHPGWDIISRNAATESIERYIEVKGTTYEWKLRGVGLSSLQFREAQERGDQYWLYVVEFALEEDGARVHPIQSPALKVDHFMFD